MNSLDNLLQAISEHDAPQGKIFEDLLSPWVLKNHPFYKKHFRKLWAFNEFPDRWLPKDHGTDLVALDIDGKYWAIQAKHYGENHTITKNDISRFHSDSDKEIISYRMLIATTDKINQNGRKTLESSTKPFIFLGLSKLREEIASYPKNLQGLETEKYKPKKVYRLPHQKEAIKDVVKKLKNRGQLIMACGTGKTYTSQWIDEDLNSKSTLILFPSLLLLSKTLNVWKPNDKHERIYLPVCSDDSVRKEDKVQILASEIGYPVTTNPDDIAAFLKKRARKVILSTYQSADKIAEAFAAHKLKPFDLIIYDEAHRLAGKITDKSLQILDNLKVPSKKRLFMTATPKVYSPQTKASIKARNFEVTSMDDKKLFGEELHRLSFGKSIEKKLLTDYQVILMGMSSKETAELINDRAFVKIKNVIQSDAHSIACQVALLQAIKKFNLNRVITFHNRVKDANQFATDTSKIRSAIKSKKLSNSIITSEAIDGNMPTSLRNQKLKAMEELSNEDVYVLSNSRILSEGVDVPALDGVAFMAPRRSEVDIVQAVGRAMRLSKGKTKGTILIPFLVDKSKDLDEQMDDSSYDRIWKVISALRSHDEQLGNDLDELRKQLGQFKRPSLKGSKIITILPQGVPADFLDKLTTRIVEKTTENWFYWYEIVKGYMLENNHFIYSRDSQFKGVKFSWWSDHQRHLFKAKKLPKHKIDLLNQLSYWTWNPRKDKWEFGYERLKIFKQKNGHVNVKYAYVDDDGFKLGTFLDIQKRAYANGKILQTRKEKLLKLGVNLDTDSPDEAWNNWIALSHEYIKEHGDINKMSMRYITSDGKALGKWLYRQLEFEQTGSHLLTSIRKKQLEKLGLVFGQRKEIQWEQMFNELRAYKKTYGDCLVPKMYITPSGKNLGKWCLNQVITNNRGTIRTDRKAKLDSVGFVWKRDRKK